MKDIDHTSLEFSLMAVFCAVKTNIIYICKRVSFPVIDTSTKIGNKTPSSGYLNRTFAIRNFPIKGTIKNLQ